MKNPSTLVYSFVLLVSDFIALTLAFTLAFIMRVRWDDRPLLEPITAEAYIGVIAILLVFWLIIFALLGLYNQRVYDNRFKEFFMLFIGSLIGILFLIGVEYVLDRSIFPARLVTVYGFFFAFLLTLLFRTICRGTRRLLFKFNKGVTNVLLVGTTDITRELVINLNRPHHGFKVIGVVGDRRASIPGLADNKHFSSFSEAVDSLKVQNIHNIVQTELFSDDDRNDEVLDFAQSNHIAFRFVPGNNRIFSGSIEVNLFEGIPTISVHQTALTGWGRVAKRLFDLIIGLFMIIITSPIMLLAWIALMFSGGSPIFRQTRMSRYNTRIGLYKFRSLKHAYNGLSPEEAFAKMGKPDLAKKYRENGDFLDKDPRISGLGKFLRRTSIDELPQFFNVLKGDISLVGPRPLVPEEMAKYEKRSVILSVKPGLTGLAVVSGRRNISFAERRKLDTYYSQNWSFWLDIVILAKTAVMVLRGDGAK